MPKFKNIKIIKKIREKPPKLSGKVCKELSADKDFTLAKFKKRFNIK